MPKTVPSLPGDRARDLPVLAGGRGQRLRVPGRPDRRRAGVARARPGRHRGRDAGDARERRPPAPGGRARLSDVVKATVYLTDIADFAAMNTIYREYFPAEPPTRATVAVTGLALRAPASRSRSWRRAERSERTDAEDARPGRPGRASWRQLASGTAIRCR